MPVPIAATAAALHVALTAATLQGLPHTTVTATDEKGKTAVYGGIAMREILTRAGVPSGPALRGRQMARYVVVDASDGYRVVLALPELDPGFTDRVVLLADTRDGQPPAAAEGPYRLIIPGERRDARWIRNITAIDIEEAPDET